MYKKLILFSIIVLFCMSALPPSSLQAEAWRKLKPQGAVNDFADLIDPVKRAELENILTKVEAQSGIAIVIATIPALGDYTIEEAAVELFEKWGIGKKGIDKGLLFITALQERRTRIEVGYGLEEAVPDALIGSLLDSYAVPYFKNNDFNLGIYNTTLALIDQVSKYYNLSIDYNKAPLTEKNTKKAENWFNLLFFIIFIILLIRNPKTVLFFLLSSSLSSGRSSRGFGGGFGNNSGGFGGFGGGMSGGGGASRGF